MYIYIFHFTVFYKVAQCNKHFIPNHTTFNCCNFIHSALKIKDEEQKGRRIKISNVDNFIIMKHYNVLQISVHGLNVRCSRLNFSK